MFIFQILIKKQSVNIFLAICLITECWAEVVLDGSLGKNGGVQGPHFLITEDMGKYVGRNLFHSFSEFNLDKSESVTFSSLQPIDNIINRVTSGKTSFIDGKLVSDIPEANFFLINPQGFVFGENARLNVQGSFYASTASHIKLGTEGRFDAKNPKNSLLVSAPPSTFGFLDSPSSTIFITGNKLSTPPNEVLSFSSGKIDIESAKLTAISGRIYLVGIESAKDIDIHSPDLTAKKLGQITMKNKAILDVGKRGGGNIFIRSGRFEMSNSNIIATTKTDKDGGVIAIDVEELYLDDSRIDNNTLGEGEGGDIFISASGEVSLKNSNIFTTSPKPDDRKEDEEGKYKESTLSTLFSSEEYLEGNAGDIFLTSEYLNLLNSTISTATFGRGQGGDIYITVLEDITLDSVSSGNVILLASTNIQAYSGYKEDFSGNAGNIEIKSKNLYLTGNSTFIDNSTKGTGRGGNISLDITNVLSLDKPSRISGGSSGTGKAGNIFLNINHLDMIGGVITTDADHAEGGNIIINAHELVTLCNNSKITATVSGGNGNGGNVVLANPRFFQLLDSRIIANASQGRGGTIVIVAQNVVNQKNSVISASSEHGSDGEVEMGMPDVDTSTLSAHFLDASSLIKKRCAARLFNNKQSSFIITGRNGLPNAPDDLQTYIPNTNE